MNAFWIALQFFTRLPSPTVLYDDDAQVSRSALFYPLIGAIIGALLLSFTGLLQLIPAKDFLSTSPELLAALVLLLWVTITGALHLDGLGDSADAWLGGSNKQRSLEIMQDPRAGTAAVVTIVLLLLLKFTALTQLFSQHIIWPLLLAPVLGRTAALALLLTTPSARPSGFGSQIIQNLPRLPAISVILITSLLICFYKPIEGGIVLLCSVLMTLLLRSLMLIRLAGATGDTCGALIEIIEALCLVTLCFIV
jgi:adenosylcobinamide-GDP ribazoletransferase